MIDVVLCGNLRSEVAFVEIVRELLAAKGRGTVGQVVFSTWNSELERFPQLAEALTQAGVDVVSFPQPAPYIDSLVIQHLQFWRGLQVLRDPDGWVLKCRTDRAWEQTHGMLRAVEQGVCTELPRPSAIHSHKLIVNAISLNEPFSHIDFVVLCHKTDARRILNFDIAFDYIYSDTGRFAVDSRWFIEPVLTQAPEYKRLLEQVNVQRLALAIKIAAGRGELASAPEDVMLYLGSYWSVAYDLYALPDRSVQGPSPKLEPLLSGTVDRPFTVDWGERVLVTNQPCFAALANGVLEDSDLARRLTRHRTSVKDYGRVLAGVDLDALVDFTVAYTGELDRRRVVSVRHADPSGSAPVNKVFEALIRTPLPEQLLTDAYGSVAAGLDRAHHGSGDLDLTGYARKLDAEARASGDRERAQVAFLIYQFGAYNRDPEASAGACALAFDGWVSPEQRREAFTAIYSAWHFHQDSPAAIFWYGIHHMTPWSSGHVNREHGLEFVRKAADLGYEPARQFLLDPTLPD